DEQFLSNLFPESLRKRFGKDPDKYIKYYQENMEYLHPGGTNLVVDDDVKTLGVSNRKVELLDRCIDLLEKGEKTDLALRILKRNTQESYSNAKDWRVWLQTNRESLFFTDPGGYKFMVAPKGLNHKQEPAAITTTVGR